MTDMPWDKFYWSDWDGDEKLRMCSPGAQALWMRMLCICSRANGYLMVADQALDAEALQTVTGWPLEDVTNWLADLEKWQVFSRDRRGVIYSRRIVKSKIRARKAREVGVLGGNPNLRKDNGISATDNLFPTEGLTPRGRARAPATQKLEARSQRLDSKNPPKDKSLVGAHAREKRGSRIAADWVPTVAEISFAEARGFSGPEIQRMAARFKNYWEGAAGPNARKANWTATWRNWVDREADTRPPAGKALNGRYNPNAPPSEFNLPPGARWIGGQIDYDWF